VSIVQIMEMLSLVPKYWGAALFMASSGQRNGPVPRASFAAHFR